MLLNITGDGITFARASIVPEEILPAAVNQHVSIIRVNQTKCLPGYLLAYLCLPHVKEYIGSFNAGGSRRAVTKGHIESFEVPLAPLLVQEAIQENVYGLLSKIQLNRQINQTLEQMAQALFKSWFVDFDPVIDNALAAGNPIPEALQARADRRAELARSGNTPQLPDHIRTLFPDRFTHHPEMSWIPEGWEVKPVGKVLENVGGGTPRTKEDAFWAGGLYPFCTPKDMSLLTSKTLLETERHLTDAGVAKISSGQLPKGTVLMSSRAPIGYLAITEVPVSLLIFNWQSNLIGQRKKPLFCQILLTYVFLRCHNRHHRQ